jgi:uncharacterized protein (DUF3084 family)
MDEKEIREKAIQEAEKADGQWDKERQRADQAEANFRKAQAEKDKLNAQMEQMQQQYQQQRNQLAELNAQSQATKSITDSLPDIDPENADIEDIAKAVSASRRIIAEQAKEVAALKAKASQYEQETTRERQQREERERRNQTLNEICTDLEEEFGSGLRNDAIKLMEKMNEEQGLPSNSAKAVLRLRNCFKKAKEDKGKNTDTAKVLMTDTGGGGGRPVFGNPNIKKGSLDDVAGQYSKLTGG